MISAIGFPLLLAFGGVAAWMVSKNSDKRESEAPKWRDDSLDDWRRARDAAAEAERGERVVNAKTGLFEGSEAEGDEKQHKQQRIGG